MGGVESIGPPLLPRARARRRERGEGEGGACQLREGLSKECNGGGGGGDVLVTGCLTVENERFIPS
jgi:hypothetical protein